MQCNAHISDTLKLANCRKTFYSSECQIYCNEHMTRHWRCAVWNEKHILQMSALVQIQIYFA
jgi:hypothetical protein